MSHVGIQFDIFIRVPPFLNWYQVLNKFAHDCRRCQDPELPRDASPYCSFAHMDLTCPHVTSISQLMHRAIWLATPRDVFGILAAGPRSRRRGRGVPSTQRLWRRLRRRDSEPARRPFECVQRRVGRDDGRDVEDLLPLQLRMGPPPCHRPCGDHRPM